MGISNIKIRYQYHKTPVFLWDIFILRRTPGAQFMNDIPKIIQIRWKLDFKCNFIVGIISLQHFAQLSCHVQNFITIISPNLGWECEISIDFNYDWKIVHEIDGSAQDCSNSITNTLELLQSCAKPSKCAPAAQIHAGPCVWYGPTPDHCRQKVCCWYNTWLLTSPDVMCKYNLIKPQNNNKHCDNMHIVCGNKKLLVSRNFQAPLS